MGVAADDPVIVDVFEQVFRVAELIDSGDPEGAAKVFVEDVALGPGAWDLLPPEERARMANNAPTFADELQDPDGTTLDLAALATSPTPMLLSYGGQSPPFFEKVVDVLRAAAPNLRVEKMEAAGHLPHLTNSPEWIALVRDFLAQV